MMYSTGNSYDVRESAKVIDDGMDGLEPFCRPAKTRLSCVFHDFTSQDVAGTQCSPGNRRTAMGVGLEMDCDSGLAAGSPYSSDLSDRVKTIHNSLHCGAPSSARAGLQSALGGCRTHIEVPKGN